MHLQFAVDIVRVGLDRVEQDVKPGADLEVGQPLGYQQQDIKLAFAEWFDQPGLVDLQAGG